MSLTTEIFMALRDSYWEADDFQSFVLNGKFIIAKGIPTSYNLEFIFEIDEQQFTLVGPMMILGTHLDIKWIDIPPTEEQLILMKLLFT